MTDTDRTILRRQNYFQTVVHIQKVKDAISGKNENKVIKVLENLGFILGKDFVRQYPIAQRFVLDFAFVNEQVALEVDGDDHNSKKQVRKDRMRDSYLHRNNWVTIRIRDRDMFSTYKFSFYKNLIREIVEERRECYQNGNVRIKGFDNFNENDYN